MQYIFSPRNRFSTWRQLWVYLAESERELGLDISKEALQQLKEHQRIEDDEFAAAALEEKRRRHDVMAHVHPQNTDNASMSNSRTPAEVTRVQRAYR